MEGVDVVRDRVGKARGDVFPSPARVVRAVESTGHVSVWPLADRRQQAVWIIGMRGDGPTVKIGKALGAVRP